MKFPTIDNTSPLAAAIRNKQTRLNMNIKEAYKNWSEQYDTNINKTRDLEAISLRDMLSEIKFEKCLEIGCGTGKNTEWLVTKGENMIAVDISDEMLSIAKQKVTDKSVSFIIADVTV